MIAAQQYYIEYGTDMNVERLFTLLQSYIPDYCLTNNEKSVDRWAQLIVMAYKKVFYRVKKFFPFREKFLKLLFCFRVTTLKKKLWHCV